MMIFKYLKYRTKYLKTLVTTLLFICSIAYAANIKGYVYDKNTNQPLIGATIVIEGTTNGANTNKNGFYEIADIESCLTCEYTLKIMYIGYEDAKKEFSLYDDNDILDLNIYLNTSSLESEEIIITGNKRQDKVTDAPAAIEIVSAGDIKKEESTNLGSYLKGIKGVDFTSSGINNYSISVRGFNSSFTTRLLTLTDGRIANIPALRVINYSTIPQSSKDIETIEVVLGPSTALYGANAHSGVVNIISKSPADSEGLDLSFSGSAFDNRNLYKFNGRWAQRINRKLSFKFSAMYLQAYEWEFVSEEEYKLHTYAYSGTPGRIFDGKDNNPWADGGGTWATAKKDTIQINGIDKWKFIGDGEANNTGDPDGDGFMGEDWYNGYDDDGDGLIDEDYFFADGIDNDGDCPGDTNGDGCICCSGDYNVDEYIDWTTDNWFDGADNNGDGEYDETRERYSGQAPYFLPNWRTDIEFEDVIVFNGRKNEWIINQYGDTLRHNSWYDGENDHLRGVHYYSEDSIKLYFDVFTYDFGVDGIAGDNAWIDLFGDNTFTPSEGNNVLFGEPIPSEGCLENPFFGNGQCGDMSDIFNVNFDCGFDGLCPDDDGYPGYADLGEGNGTWDSFDWNNNGSYNYGDDWTSTDWVDSNNNNIPDEENISWEDTYPFANGIHDNNEQILDYGQDGIANTNDYGENDGNLILIDQNELDGYFDIGDGCYGCNAEPYTDLNENGHYDINEPFEDTNSDGKWTPEDYEDNFQFVSDLNGDGLDDYPDFEIKNSKVEFRLDYDPNYNTNISFQTGVSHSKTQQVTGTGRYLTDGYIYKFYQLRGRYKNWFAQLYLNQGNSGDTRGYLLGNVIKDRSKNLALQIQHNKKYKNTKLVWGFDFFKTIANTNGSVLNDGPNGYDNDGDGWYLSANDLDDDFDSNDYWDTNGNGKPDPGEPGVNDDGFVYADGLDNDGDGQDLDGDGYPYFQEIQMGTDPSNNADFPYWVSPSDYTDAVDELIDENWCGNQEYFSFVDINDFSGFRDGRIWTCSEGVDEPNEYLDVTSNEMGFYFQTKTNPKGNKKWDIITAARFDHHDQLDEGIQFAPKFGVFYKPNDYSTFRFTYGKAYNTPSAINLYTDLFVGRRGIVEYYLRGNKDGTPYERVGDQFNVSAPQILIDGELHYLGYGANQSVPSIEGGYWDTYNERVEGAPYFLGFNTNFINTPDYIPLDTAIYTVWVPELNDTGRIYTAEEAMTISDVSPIKTEKIQTIEIGYKGFFTKRLFGTIDFYTSFYEDFFSSPTVITPLIVDRVFDSNGNDITNIDNVNIVGMMPMNRFGSNAPYGTQWDGLDNDNDWDVMLNNNTSYNIPYYENNANGSQCPVYSNCYELNLNNPIYHNTDTDNDGNDDAFQWYHEFGWDGYIDNNGRCINCEAEWGYVDFITCGGNWAGGDIPCVDNMETGDTLGFTIYQPEDVTTYTDGVISYGSHINAAQFWIPVGIDEYSAITGLSEAEYITSPVIGADGEPLETPGFAYTPLHSILAPMNYGNVNMSGIDIGLTYFMTEYNLTLDGNFSFYNTTEYYNSLTRKNDPINAPKFKMNAGISWDSPYGGFAVKYRHVDKFIWKDGIWSGTIGPYDLIDIHYNYKLNDYLELNLTGQNIFDDQHKELIGGAVMGRTIIVRLNASI